MKIYFNIGVLFLFIFTNIEAFSGINTETYELEKQLEDRITPIVRSFDLSAFVLVKVEAKHTSSETLPGTPYQVRDMVYRDSNGQIEIEKTEITIFGNDTKLLTNSIPMVTKFATRFGVKPIVKVDANRDVASASESKVQKIHPIEEINSTFKTITGIASGFLKFLKIVLLVALGIIGIMVTFIYFGFKTSAEKLGGTLERNLMTLNSTIESGGGSSQKSESKINLNNDLPAAQSNKNETLDFPDETVISCLADCYWGQHDGYAHYIWNRLPISSRSRLIKLAPKNASFLIDYTTFVRTITESNLQAIDDPSYLNPMPIELINNLDLTQLVRQKPELLYKLSPLRMNGLSLTLAEKIKTRKSPIKADPSSIDFESLRNHKPSEKRELKRSIAIQIHSVQEEQELIKNNVKDKDLYQDIASLVWSLELSKENLSDVLKPFSAKDLAMSWIGPEQALNHISECIPSKKLELIKSLQSKVTPSRNCQAFILLHRALVTKIEATPSTQLPASVSINPKINKHAA